MLTALRHNLRRLHESRAYELLLHPGVLARHAQFQQEREARPLVMNSTPSSIEIEITNRCNLACVQCLRSQGLKPYALGDISLDEFARILDQFPNAIHVC